MVNAPVWTFLGHLLPIGPYGFVAHFWTTHTVTILIRLNPINPVYGGCCQYLTLCIVVLPNTKDLIVHLESRLLFSAGSRTLTAPQPDAAD